MQVIEAYYDGRAFVPTVSVAVRINERAVVTILEDTTDKRPKRKDDKAAAEMLHKIALQRRIRNEY